MASTIVYEICEYTYKIIILKLSAEIIPFIKILAIETIYNAILTIILYPIMQKLGYKIEDTFKNSQILTRYF